MKAILLAVFLCVPVLAQQPADFQEIQRLVEKYAKSIDAADTVLAAQIRSQSPDVSCIHPRGHEHGFDQVKQNFYVRTMGDMFSERKLTIKDIAIRVYGYAAWAEFDWDFVAKLKGDGVQLMARKFTTTGFQGEGAALSPWPGHGTREAGTV